MTKIHNARRRALTGRLYAIAFSLMLAPAGCSLRTQPLATPATDEAAPVVLRIGTSGDYAPFSVWPQAGPVHGFSISVAEAYAAEMGIAIEWVRFRWPDVAERLGANDFDLAISGITIRADRSMRGRFALPLTTSGAVVLVPDESKIQSATDLDHPSITIAVNAGGHLERVARHLFPAARIDPIPDNARVLERLAARSDGSGASETADAVVTDSLEAPHWQRTWAVRAAEGNPARTASLRALGPLTRDLKAAWFSTSREAEARRFDAWLLSAESTGLLARLRQQHGLPADETAAPIPSLLSSLDERLALMPAVAEAKAALDIPIENEGREKIVLEAAVRSVEAAARDAGVAAPDLDDVRRLFRVQIEAAKWIQAETLRSSGDATSTPASAEERDRARQRLDARIRPALLYLGDRIARLIVECGRSPSPELDLEDVRLALAARNLPAAQAERLYEALGAVLRFDRRNADALRPAPTAG